MSKKKSKKVGKARMRRLAKIQIHEHLDCSLRPLTMLQLWSAIGFDQAGMAFPQKVMTLWEAAQAIRDAADGDIAEAEKLEKRAARTYQKWLAGFASASLANYVKAIVDHVLPLMQTAENLTRITRERIEDAVNDGIIGMELRFAPQLHTFGGLSLHEVMDAVIAAVDESPFPLKLIVCALRHEDKAMCKQLADLAIEYKAHVGVFDLAADEALNPGVLKWWLPKARRVRRSGIKLTIHMWETNEPTDDDIELLDDNEIDRLGHGVRGDRQGDRYLEVCPTSNVVTAQYDSIEDHPIDDLYRAGKRVTVNTDGTLFTEVDLTGEYLKLQDAFGWTLEDFFTVNITALEASSFDEEDKASIREQLEEAYGMAA